MIQAHSPTPAPPCQALDSLRLALSEEQSLRESAALYAEVYDEDDDLKALTKSALADWPAYAA